MGMAVAELGPEYGVELSDKDLEEFFWQSYDASDAWFGEWRNETIPGLYAQYGNQTWSETDKRWMKDTKKPSIEVNIAANTLHAIMGSDAADRREVEFHPVESETPLDGFKAEALTHLARVLLKRCKGHAHDMATIHHLLVSGYGWEESYLDAGQIPMLAVKRAVAPWEMWADPFAIEDNLTDARFVIRRRTMTLEDAQARWPERASELADLHQDVSGNFSQTPRVSDSWTARNPVAAKGKLSVFEFQFCRSEPRVLYVDPKTDEATDVTPEEWTTLVKALKEQAGLGGEPYVEPVHFRHPKKIYYRAFLGTNLGSSSDKRSAAILQKAELKIGKFTYDCVTGYKRFDPEEGKMVCFSTMELISDVSRYVNRTASAVLEIMSRATKAGGMLEQTALGDKSIETFIKEQATIGYWSVVADGAITEKKIKENTLAQFPSGLERLFQTMMGLIPEISGVSSIVKGTAAGERSASLVANLQHQALVIVLAPLLANIENLRESTGRTVVKIALREMPRKAVERLVGTLELEGVTFETVDNPETGEKQQVPILDEMTGQPVTASSLILDDDPMAYDVTVDVGAYSPSAKMAVWEMNVQHGTMQQFMEMGALDIVADMYRYSPYPTSVAERIAGRLEAMMGEQQQTRTYDGMRATLAQMSENERADLLTQLAGEFMPREQPQPTQMMGGVQ